MHTVLDAAGVSAQHAAIAWDGQRWTLRDLASRNGTWLEGRRLGPGEVAPLVSGALIELGRPGERMTFADDAPPAPCARSGELYLEGQDELLAIPSPEDPVVVIVYDPEEGWLRCEGGQSGPVRSGAEVDVVGRRWSLTLPEAVAATAEVRAQRVEAPALALSFKVTPDEEYVELTAELGGIRHSLPARAHHYLLLTLARARMEDAQVPASGQGWVYTSDLLTMLRQSANQLYVSLHRARRELEAIGLPEGVELFERRTTTRQLRLAVSTLQVETL
jgi:hypothetical protein